MHGRGDAQSRVRYRRNARQAGAEPGRPSEEGRRLSDGNADEPTSTARLGLRPSEGSSVQENLDSEPSSSRRSGNKRAAPASFNSYDEWVQQDNDPTFSSFVPLLSSRFQHHQAFGVRE